MARQRNLENLKTEKEGVLILRKKEPTFHVPTTEERRLLYTVLEIDYKKYSRSVDGILMHVAEVSQIKSAKDVTLVEIKTTKAKNAINLPYGAFFGITKNEEDLFKSMDNYRLCIVHSLTEDYAMVTYKEYISLIQNKRIQYQVNFRSKE